MRNLVILITCLVLFIQCKSTENISTTSSTPIYRVGFYNVENLFDLKDEPAKFDDEFTPTGRNKWTKERYDHKLNNLSKVINGMGNPVLLGLCEVENKTVLKDLTATSLLKPHGYQFAHFESPDMRGIDVALLYKSKMFSVLDEKKIRIDFPDSIAADYTSRDILQVKGILQGKDTLHVFVNHWPSRRGGTKASQAKRVHVASYLKKAVDELLSQHSNANIIIMGDFNDEPINDSIIKTLGVQRDREQANLYNCFIKADQNKEGSYNYRGNWNMLDQIIISSSIKQALNGLKARNATIFRKEWMLYKDPKHGPRPNRSYGGPNYYGGYSDHLPVFIDLVSQ